MAVKTEIIGDTTFWNGVPMPFVTPGVVVGSIGAIVTAIIKKALAQ